MEKYDVIPDPDDMPDRGNYPKIGNSDYRFNLWYKFPKLIEKKRADDGLYHGLDNYHGEHNFVSDDLIDYMRESMSGIKLIEDFDKRDDYWSSVAKERVKYVYRIAAFIPERECGMDSVYAQENMKSFDEIDYQKSGEWIAKMLEKLGAVLDVDKCIERIKRQQAEAKALIDSNEELFAIVGEANEKLEATINSHKEKEE
jgi:hypothetical protein